MSIMKEFNDNDIKNKEVDIYISNNIKSVDSWDIISNEIIVKNMDKSVFVSKESGIPKDTSFFWSIEGLNYGCKKEIVLLYNGIRFNAYINMDKKERTKIHWYADLKEIILEKNPEYERYLHSKDNLPSPKMIFRKLEGSLYELQFSNSYSEHFLRKEGRCIYGMHKSYERDTINREEAIKYHGTKCAICGFDFEEVYGYIGAKFIEIHHKKPLSSLKEEMNVDPRKDLVPVCSNCHSIIHRDKGHALTVEEVKKIIEDNKII